MKTVFSNSELPHVWAHQKQSEGRNPNRTFYFYGDTIYSYGSHFAIATHFDGMVLFTTRTYSNTTAKQVGEVRRACSHMRKIYCAYPRDAKYGHHSGNVKDLMNDIIFEYNKIERARIKSNYMRAIANKVDQANVYFEIFPDAKEQFLKKQNFDYSDSMLKVWYEVTSEAWQAKYSAILAEEKRKELAKNDPAYMTAKEKERAERAAKIAELVPGLSERFVLAWRNGAEKYFIENLKGLQKIAFKKIPNISEGLIKLRVINGNLETSKGIKIPVLVAERYYRIFLQRKETGNFENYEIQGYKVNGFENDILTVGCHNIPMTEIEYFAELLRLK